ncbi:MAG: hypothetical protein DI538_31520 [Azospira oryzae]|nr:MAG: hypothetical protein DI538_31520 [Azospira oryzae]
MLDRLSAQGAVPCRQARWQRDGLPAYAQFDNDTVFQGAHQFADTVGRVSRLCLALGVIPVFVPPLEHGMQNTIEGFNALGQAKVAAPPRRLIPLRVMCSSFWWLMLRVRCAL